MVGLWGQIVVNMPYIFTNFHEVSFDNANIHTISTNLNSMLFSDSRICNVTDVRLFYDTLYNAKCILYAIYRIQSDGIFINDHLAKL